MEKGLIEVVEGGAHDPFDATYKLTPTGEQAAEYGEYEVDIPGVSADAPVTGLMAELVKAKSRPSKNGKATVGEPEPTVAFSVH